MSDADHTDSRMASPGGGPQDPRSERVEGRGDAWTEERRGSTSDEGTRHPSGRPGTSGRHGVNDAGAGAASNPQRMGPERWVIGGGTVVALVAAFIAFTAGGTPSHAMPSPFATQPYQSAPGQGVPGQGVPSTTCTSFTPGP
jgi:hypothetical protein